MSSPGTRAVRSSSTASDRLYLRNARTVSRTAAIERRLVRRTARAASTTGASSLATPPPARPASRDARRLPPPTAPSSARALVRTARTRPAARRPPGTRTRRQAQMNGRASRRTPLQARVLSTKIARASAVPRRPLPMIEIVGFCFIFASGIGIFEGVNAESFYDARSDPSGQEVMSGRTTKSSNLCIIDCASGFSERASATPSLR